MEGLRFAGLQTEEPVPGSCSGPAEYQEVCPAPCEVKAGGFPGEAPAPPRSIHSAPFAAVTFRWLITLAL